MQRRKREECLPGAEPRNTLWTTISRNQKPHLPLSWGGSSTPPQVSGIFLEWGKDPLGNLLRVREEANSFESLLREALSAMAAATREEWSVSLALHEVDEKAAEFRSIAASGSFSAGGSCVERELSGFSDGLELGPPHIEPTKRE